MEFLIAFYIVILLTCYMAWRNVQVYNFRMWVNHRIYTLASTEKRDSPAWHTHMREEESRVSYDHMMYVFWRPLTKFYDSEFIKALEEKN